MEKGTSTNREIWLDGLRGFAAFIVAWVHMTLGKFGIPYRSYWDSPASENRHLIQIAPFRIFFSGQAMVTVFFVVSGYSISTGLIKLRNEGSLIDFYRKLTSSVVRRMFRLCFPVAFLMLTSHVLYYAGLYTLEFGKGQGCPGAKPWGSPIPHIECLLRSFFSIVNLQKDQDLTLNSHLWTIPIEIRGSMKVYLTLLGLSTVSESVRKLVIGLLAVRAWWNGGPEYMAFFAGLLLAEQSGASSSRQTNSRLPPYSDSSKPNAIKPTPSRRVTLLRYLAFSIGIYLLSLPAPTQPDSAIKPVYPADWFFIDLLPPLPWWDLEATVRTWQTFGAILVVSSIHDLPKLKIILESKVAQFLGYISFSLYLCHQTVYRIMLHWSLHWTSLCATGISYFDAYPEGRWGIVFVAWALSIPLIWTILILASRHMATSVDQKSVKLGFYIEKLFSR